MATILGFDVSQGYCSVAVSVMNEVVAYHKLFYVSQQAELLIPTIEQTLKEAKLNYSDLDYIATTVGPGSFTGIRIGLAAAQGLLLSLSAQPIAITNFDVINYRVQEQVSNIDYVITLVDAYRDECYYQIFNNTATTDESNTNYGLISNKDFSFITDLLAGNIYCAGSGLFKIIDYIDSSKIKSQLTFLPRFNIPDARIICKTAYQKLLMNTHSSNLNPLYIRKADAKPSIKI